MKTELNLKENNIRMLDALGKDNIAKIAQNENERAFLSGLLWYFYDTEAIANKKIPTHLRPLATALFDFVQGAAISEGILKFSSKTTELRVEMARSIYKRLFDCELDDFLNDTM